MADTPQVTTGQELVSMAQQFTGLPMDSLIGGPLKAAATANAAMAVNQTQFILDTCFTQKTTGSDADAVKSYEPIMLIMKLTRGVLQPQPAGTDGTVPPPVIVNVDTTFNLPLLTIIPLNSLGVDTVDVTFEMEVKSSFSNEVSDTQKKSIQASADLDLKLGYGPFSVGIKGHISYDNEDTKTHSTHYEKSNSAKYTIHVHAGQLPLPKGVNTIIEAFTKAVEPISMPNSANSK